MSLKSIRGRFIVCEGTDGSGKATQAKLLVKRLEKEGVTVKYLDFPQYDGFYGQIVGEFLHGDLGDPSQIHPKLSSIPYALDRQKRAAEIKDGLSEGVWFVSSRYALSNAAHQTARVPKEERGQFVRWLEELEYIQLGIAKEDHYYYLYVPSDIGQTLVDKKGERDYMSGNGRDILEADLGHQLTAAEMYVQLSERYPHVSKFNCCGEDGKLMSIEKIHEMVWEKTMELYGHELREGRIKGERG